MNYNYSYAYVQQTNSFTSILSVALNVLLIIAWWKIFTKADVEGWKSLIPVYNSYLQYKIAWSGRVFWQVLIIGFAGSLIGTLLIAAGDALTILGILVLVATVVWLIVIQAKLCSRLAKSFGKPTSFAVGLFFLNAIFICILAFGQNEYQGPIE